MAPTRPAISLDVNNGVSELFLDLNDPAFVKIILDS